MTFYAILIILITVIRASTNTFIIILIYNKCLQSLNFKITKNFHLKIEMDYNLDNYYQTVQNLKII
jgi:hypothetical protein